MDREDKEETNAGLPDRDMDAGEISRLLETGTLVLSGGEVAFADARALELLGCAAENGIAGRWSELRPLLEAAGLPVQGTGSSRAEIAVPGPEPLRLVFDLRRDGRGGGVLLVRDRVVEEALEADLRRASLLRTLSQITPAVAHDLRAPINAMVFNIEILKETISSGRGAEPGGRERQLRYVSVLREELARLHRELEIYIAQLSPRGDRDEVLDLREVVGELASLLAGPARKQQVRIVPALPEARVAVHGNRFALRQVLLHLAVAALGMVPRDGELELGVEARGGNARVRVAGLSGTVAGAGPEPAPGFALHALPAGVLARLWSARTLLAGQGGRLRLLGETGDPQAYEVELPLVQELEKETQ